MCVAPSHGIGSISERRSIIVISTGLKLPWYTTMSKWNGPCIHNEMTWRTFYNILVPISYYSSIPRGEWVSLVLVVFWVKRPLVFPSNYYLIQDTFARFCSNGQLNVCTCRNCAGYFVLKVIQDCQGLYIFLSDTSSHHHHDANCLV